MEIEGEVVVEEEREEKQGSRRRGGVGGRWGGCLCRRLKLQQDGNLRPQVTAACL